MQSFIIPTLSVSNGAAAIEFYKKAFGAEVIAGNTDPDGNTVAELSIQGARIVVADASPAHKNFAPEVLGGISVRIGLMTRIPWLNRQLPPELQRYTVLKTSRMVIVLGILLIRMGITGR